MKDLAAALAAGGVGAAFGVPGSGASLALLTELEGLGLPVVGVAHEAAAVMMAGGFGRLSGALACAVSIKGPGLANMLPGLALARSENWPLLSLAEAYEPGSRFRMHKRLDHRAASAPFVKAHATLAGPGVPELLALARAETPGPVHLDLATSAAEAAPTEAGTEVASVPAEAILRQIDGSRRPLVIAGGVAARRPWGGRLGALRVPVLTTVAAKGVLDERGPFAAGVYTGDGGPAAPERALLAECDLVVGLGLRAGEVLQVERLRAPLALADVAARPQVAGWDAACLAGASDAEMAGILDALSGSSWGEDAVAGSVGSLRDRLTADAWLPGAVFAALERCLPDQATLVVDTGLFCTAAEHVFRARTPRSFLASANARFMGVALPMALGAALGARERPVVVCAGDGGLPPYLAEWRLAVSRRLRVLLLLMSDGGYGSVALAAGERGRATSLLDVPLRSWRAAVEAMGCPAVGCRDLGAFEAEVGRWLGEGGPRFVELAFPRERYRRSLEGIR